MRYPQRMRFIVQPLAGFAMLLAGLLPPTASAAAVGALLLAAGPLDESGPLFWIAAAPAIYVGWLLTLLLLYAVEVQLLRRQLDKPRRLDTRDGHASGARVLHLGRMYHRAALLERLPFYRMISLAPCFSNLARLAFVPRVPRARNVVNYGKILDPDLTTLGDRVVIGTDAQLVAHTVTVESDQGYVFNSAPIEIGEEAVIGGASFIGMGVRVGARAVVELNSFVAPFTIVGPDEVWGGHPAVFLRMRGAATRAAAREAGIDLELGRTEQLQRLVADALGIPRDHVGPEFCRAENAAWDSLGQMAVAAAVFNQFGVEFDHRQIFSIDSIRSLAGALSQRDERDERDVAECELPLDPELLPLFDIEQASQALSRREQAAPQVKMRLCVASTFSAQPLEAAAKDWSRAFGIELSVEFHGFDQLVQALVDTRSPFHSVDPVIPVLLARPEDLSADKAASILDAIDSFATGPGAAHGLVVASLPPVVSGVLDAEREAAESLRSEWTQRLRQVKGIETLPLAEIVESIGTRDAANPELDAVARLPYAARVFQMLGVALARIARRRSGLHPTAKVIALDCDGTLWGGVVGEDGVDGVEIGDDGRGRAFKRFQERLLALKGAGAILALVSRNEPADVWEVFDRHPGMLLKRDDIAAARIGWGDKSTGLREIAEELNVGLDSLVLLDDDPAVRMEVSARAAEVTVVPLPPAPERYVETLSRLWLFDATATTREDRARTRMIREERVRQQVQQNADGLEQYLAQLQLHVVFRLAREEDLQRVAQLTQKTNQFNLSLRRRSVEEIRTLATQGDIYIVSARDRFGEYGTIGTAIVTRVPGTSSTVELDTLLLSCRALGRGIEQAFLSSVCHEARARGARRIEGDLVHGPRNQPVHCFVEQYGFVSLGEGRLGRELEDVPPLPSHIQWVSEMPVLRSPP